MLRLRLPRDPPGEPRPKQKVGKSGNGRGWNLGISGENENFGGKFESLGEIWVFGGVKRGIWGRKNVGFVIILGIFWGIVVKIQDWGGEWEIWDFYGNCGGKFQWVLGGKWEFSGEKGNFGGNSGRKFRTLGRESEIWGENWKFWGKIGVLGGNLGVRGVKPGIWERKMGILGLFWDFGDENSGFWGKSWLL